MERIRVFLWQVVVGALLTNQYRFSRHIIDDPTYSRCNLHVHETTLHVLRDCPLTAKFWGRLVDVETYPAFCTIYLRT